jgi:AcrR family transcriptional regulator
VASAERARRDLDRAQVLQAAALVADESGWDALSLAAIAARLGVRPPSLYNHVGGLGEVKRALAIQCAQQLNARLLDAAAGRAGDDALHAMADAYRAFARERPGLYGAAATAPPAGDGEWQAAARAVVDVVARGFAGYGLDGDALIHAVRALRSALHGFVAIEAAGGFGLPLDLDESFRRLIDSLLTGLRGAAAPRPAPPPPPRRDRGRSRR